MPPTDPIQKAFQHDLVVSVAPKYASVPGYVNRKFYTTLPKDFDPAKPYPILFYGQGCGQTGSESGPFTTGHFLSDVLYVQLIPAAVTGETVIPSNGAPGCFQAGRAGLADSPDGPYFDQALAEIEKTYCVDTGKVYVAGYSSGAWLTNYLACARGNVIRATASSAGGLQQDHGTCTGGAAVLIMPGDATSINQGGVDIGAAPARETFIAANGCTTTTTKMFGNNNCEVHGGCATEPVVWCPNGGHVPPSADVAWAFWTSLP
jgi:poly(3-hydroxybutyrate) depolymerase